MAVTVKSTRKVVVVGWDDDALEGTHVSIQVAGEEKRTTENDGAANLYFPARFSGEVEVTIKGSKSGEESGRVKVK